jgi:hypothetical protein
MVKRARFEDSGHVYNAIEDDMTDAGKCTPTVTVKQLIDYKYNEGDILAEVQAYIDSTYGQHYVGNGEIQTVDFWESLGSLDTTARDTAIKYLARFGKKGGNNRKDLLKAIHYIVLMMYATREDTK